MNELESNLKALIIDKYGSMKKFSETIDMPWTTLDSICLLYTSDAADEL